MIAASTRHGLPQQRRHRPCMARRRGLGQVQVGHDQRAHQRLEHRLLAREVEIERALGGPARAAMSSIRAAAKPFSANTVERRVEQLGRAGILAAAGQSCS